MTGAAAESAPEATVTDLTDRIGMSDERRKVVGMNNERARLAWAQSAGYLPGVTNYRCRACLGRWKTPKGFLEHKCPEDR